MYHIGRYQRNLVVRFPEREQPNRKIGRVPIWCSVDFRGGNQALAKSIVVEEKTGMLGLLLKLGFKTIEIGFPAVSQIEFDFLRLLALRKMISPDVHVQVLTQCREHLIRRTFEAIEGIPDPIVHIYNSTNTLQRDAVFHASREKIRQIAIDGVRTVKACMKEFGCDDIILEYSPESFMGTEPDFALEVCEAVLDGWGMATPEKEAIINPLLTAEVNTPNVYADQTGWMMRHFENRDSIMVSIHPHDDHGIGVTATKLTLLTGVDRVEGMFFGSGERAGNVDILAVAYNVYSRGTEPHPNISNEKEIAEVYERCMKMSISPRHPYMGKLVFTALLGSYQDIASRGMQAVRERSNSYWQVSYLPIDLSGIDRAYQSVVRIGPQSSKDGATFAMDTFYGFRLPRGMHEEFVDIIQALSEKQGEITLEEICAGFQRTYLDRKEPAYFKECVVPDNGPEEGEFLTHAVCTYTLNGEERQFEGVGNGPIDTVRHGLAEALSLQTRVLDYSEYTLRQSSSARVASYVHILDKKNECMIYGVDASSNITRTSLRDIFSMVNRLFY